MTTVPGTATRAIVLLAHGSRDPDWARPVLAVAERMRTRAACTGAEVHCAYLELMPPDFENVAGQLAQSGFRHVIVVPLFLGMGRHARQEIPTLVATAAKAHPEVAFDLREAMGEHPEVLDLFADIALR